MPWQINGAASPSSNSTLSAADADLVAEFGCFIGGCRVRENERARHAPFASACFIGKCERESERASERARDQRLCVSWHWWPHGLPVVACFTLQASPPIFAKLSRTGNTQKTIDDIGPNVFSLQWTVVFCVCLIPMLIAVLGIAATGGALPAALLDPGPIANRFLPGRLR